MRRVLFLLTLLALPALASETYVGTLASAGTSVNNSTTATPFTLLKRDFAAIQCDAAVYINTGTTTSTAATSSNGVKLQADVLYDIYLETNKAYIAIIPVSGSANCKVFRIKNSEVQR